MIQQLKEAHSVVDRHIESNAKLSASEVMHTAMTEKLAYLLLYCPTDGNGGRIEGVEKIK